MGIPEHLQKTALEYLLNGGGNTPIAANKIIHHPKLSAPAIQSSAQDLRSFMASKVKGAVSEIPCLVYWARDNESKEAINETGIVELYRRANLRPPKNVVQSIRDLCSKKYGRLEAVKDQPGFVRLSRVGETFVIHDADVAATAQ